MEDDELQGLLQEFISIPTIGPEQTGRKLKRLFDCLSSDIKDVMQDHEARAVVEYIRRTSRHVAKDIIAEKIRLNSRIDVVEEVKGRVKPLEAGSSASSSSETDNNEPGNEEELPFAAVEVFIRKSEALENLHHRLKEFVDKHRRRWEHDNAIAPESGHGETIVSSRDLDGNPNTVDFEYATEDRIVTHDSSTDAQSSTGNESMDAVTAEIASLSSITSPHPKKAEDIIELTASILQTRNGADEMTRSPNLVKEEFCGFWSIVDASTAPYSIECIQEWLEHRIKAPISWWPLVSPRPQPTTGHIMVQWKCICGALLHLERLRTESTVLSLCQKSGPKADVSLKRQSSRSVFSMWMLQYLNFVFVAVGFVSIVIGAGSELTILPTMPFKHESFDSLSLLIRWSLVPMALYLGFSYVRSPSAQLAGNSHTNSSILPLYGLREPPCTQGTSSSSGARAKTSSNGLTSSDAPQSETNHQLNTNRNSMAESGYLY